ncbi:CocE/NonD family hydrolase [Variovorax sp. YR752]|uniref:CocE/NonD family hydrolase n=1 Tax=Variovorax sp. YR752 TaxID=1884383 RepID=UPI003137BF76
MHRLEQTHSIDDASPGASHGTSLFTVDWDVPIEMNDGIVLRADVFRPMAPGHYPVLLSYGPYGKGLSFQEAYATAWKIMVEQHPDTARGSTNRYQNWEVVDPEKWVPHGYVCVRVDSRGAGRSPGILDIHSERETQDLIDSIEWASRQPWSNSRVGLSGVSYYASNQWRAAARKPKGLAAICVWEGYNDRYRESARHGGILCTFNKNWQEMQVLSVQHGRGERGPRSAVTGELVCGPETIPEETLASLRVNRWPELVNRELDDAFYKARTPVLEDIEVPLLSAANWGGQGLHTRGNIEGFLRAGSRQKWLEIHGGAHWAGYYTDYGVALQRRFFDHFLKGEDNGWDEAPPVLLQVRRIDGTFVERQEAEWPIARTRWTRMYLDPSHMALTSSPLAITASLAYSSLQDGLTFKSAPFLQDTEITGPSAAHFVVSSSTIDADLFLVLRVFAPGGEEVVFRGALDPHTPLGQGWLRASHRKTDAEKSAPWRPYHTHDEKLPLAAGEQVSLDVEIWPTSVVVPAGYSVALTVRGKDYEYAGPPAELSNMKNPMRGCGPFVHDDPTDRPADVFGGNVTLHFLPSEPSYVLLPIVPEIGDKE